NFLKAPIASTLYATLGAISLILILQTGFLKAFRKQAYRKPVFKIRINEKAPSVAYKVLAIGAFKKFMKRSD
ncbi:MAG: hypothetical protein ACK6BS_02570, partial [Pseudanabaena sp.]